MYDPYTAGDDNDDPDALTRVQLAPTGLGDQGRTFRLPATLCLCDAEYAAQHPVQRVDVVGVDGAFVLHNVLTPRECAFWIAESERLGYESIAHLYQPSYRNNTRVMAVSRALVSLMLERSRPHLPDRLVDEQARRPAGSQQQQQRADEWTLCGMNEGLRFCKYTAGGIFRAHYDACFQRNGDEKSMLTFNVYLNDVVAAEQGGCTTFVRTRDHSRADNVIARVEPRAGSVLVFPHGRLHQGDILKSGLKYLVRSDVMYRRPGAPVRGDAEPADDAVYAEAASLWEKAKQLEPVDAMAAMELYRRATKLCPRVGELR